MSHILLASRKKWKHRRSYGLREVSVSGNLRNNYCALLTSKSMIEDTNEVIITLFGESSNVHGEMFNMGPV